MKKLLYILYSLCLILVLFGCKKSEPDFYPAVQTRNVTNISPTSATSGGNVTSDGGADIIARGVCCSTNQTPTIDDNNTNEGIGSGGFTSNIKDLKQNTTYYLRAYASNGLRTGYGDAVSFKTTIEPGAILDIEGNGYHMVTIGTQVWMTENLKTSKYCNGDLILTTTPPTMNITSFSSPKFQWAYKGEESLVNAFGRLYTWYTITDNRNVCPTGWHVPTSAEWTILITYLGGNSEAGDKLIKAGTPMIIYGTNSSGFTAILSGGRQVTGNFGGLNSVALWWSSTRYDNSSAWNLQLSSNYNHVYINTGTTLKQYGFSVRCVKD